MTHVVDFTPASAALAIAAAGAFEYEGVAANDVHCEWFDSTLDRCVMYLAGKDKQLAQQLGGDDAFMKKVEQYFSGTVMEARKWFAPDKDDEKEEGEGEEEEESSEDE